MPQHKSTITIIKENKKTWEAVAEKFLHASALPVWGPFGIGEDLNLIPMIKGKTFLEIGCGSGRSIKYLTDRGAKKVYGLDFSTKQIVEASHYNSQGIGQNTVELFEGAMEDKINIEPIDYVFSIYAIGWTPEPTRTFEHIYSYLKPGGLFIWSWDHSFFKNIAYRDGEFTVVESYHDEILFSNNGWKKSTETAHITYRKTDTWFRLLRNAGFLIDQYHEPAPVNLNHGHSNPTKYYSEQKAKLVPASIIFVCQKPSE